MPRIHRLSAHVANLIAAGEVVERPASVVKELLENAVDAGARQVTVELQGGGVSFLRVTDDGCGMDPEDAETAFLRHATSKIRTEEDLAAIGTLGFRGEALAAISSVSRVDLMSRTADAPAGVSLHLEGGAVTERTEAGCPVGTTIIVRDLFFNTPARMKFLKRNSVEGGAAAAAVQKQALAHTDVSIRLILEGEERFQTAGDGDLRAAIYAVLGRQLAMGLIPVESAWGGLQLKGFVSKPTATRGNRSNQLFFVNGRPVISKQLTAALEQAYENQLMKGRFPAAVLYLTVPADAVDVNVHPAKTEVRFLSERDVFDCVHYGVQGALSASAVETARPELQLHMPQTWENSQTAAEPAQTARDLYPRRENFFRQMDAEALREYTQSLTQKNNPVRPAAVPSAPAQERTWEREASAPVISPASLQPAPKEPLPDAEAQVPSAEMQTPVPEQISMELPPVKTWRFVGEVLNGFLIAEEGDDVLFIDKHAAHERILFEKFRAREEPVMSQTLITPVTAAFDPQDAALLLSEGSTLEELGYELEDFGGGTLLIRRIPASIALEDAEATLESLCEDLKNGKGMSADELRDELLHTVACKAAIKAGWETGREELERLCDAVLSDESLRYCPHGRPSCITVSRGQLEHQFKRT